MHYPKNVLPTAVMVQKYIDAGLSISDPTIVARVLEEIGYYRLRGYSFHLYNKVTKQFNPGTSFDTILSIYRFDEELRKLIFSMTCSIEITLRAHYCTAMLTFNDPLIYLDPALSKEKNTFWKNLSTLSSEIDRSSDVFIKHNFDNYDGMIPIWAAVEVMSFGTLSKTIKNLKDAPGTPIKLIASHYSYINAKGKRIAPNADMLTSWIFSTVTLRNICAHNSRIYNRSMTAKPQIISTDQRSPRPTFYGLYEALLAMKYLRPSDDSWRDFANNLQILIDKHSSVIDIARMNFPPDWKSHFAI